MKKGYKVNKAAGIIDIVYASLMMVGGLILLFYYLIAGTFVAGIIGSIGGTDAMEGAEAALNMFLLIILIAIIVVSVIYMVFGVKTLKICNSSAEAYYSKKSTLLTFAIIETVFVALSFASIASSAELVSLPFMLIATIILRWIGFALCVKGEKNQNSSNEVQSNQIANQSEDIKMSDENVYEKLEKLNKLKQDGAITQEEFENMKKKILN